VLFRSIAVLLKVYAHRIDGQADAANKRIADAPSTPKDQDQRAPGSARPAPPPPPSQEERQLRPGPRAPPGRPRQARRPCPSVDSAAVAAARTDA